MFDDFFSIDLVVVDFCVNVDLLHCFWIFLPPLILLFPELATGLAGKSIPEMTSLVQVGH